MFNDVFDDVVRGVVAAGSLALAAVVLEIDSAPRVGFIVGVLAAPLFEDGKLVLFCLSVGDNLLGLFAFDNGHLFWSHAQFEFQEPFVHAAELAHPKALVVDESEVVPLLVPVAGH